MSQSVQLALRLEVDLNAWLETEAKRLSELAGGVKITRTDVAMNALRVYRESSTKPSREVIRLPEVARGDNVLFVGTKRQAQDLIVEEATEATVMTAPQIASRRGKKEVLP